MLLDLHTTIQTLLYDQGRIPADEVEVTFEMPTKEWVDSRTRPTINLFLCEIEENTDLRKAGMQTTQSNGRAIQRRPPRRFDLYYMVSVLTTEIADEHMLIWRTLGTLLKYPQLPHDVMPETLRAALRALDVPLAAKVAAAEEGPRRLDLWGALELPPRPALLYIVTAPLDLEIAFEAPLVLTRTLRAGQRLGYVGIGTRIRIGGVVRDRQGQPVAGVAVDVEGSAEGSTTNTEGRFVLNMPSGTVRLRVTQSTGAPKIVTVEIPSDSYDIVLE